MLTRWNYKKKKKSLEPKEGRSRSNLAKMSPWYQDHVSFMYQKPVASSF